jgi:co-chaperonin GroES (HSP10)
MSTFSSGIRGAVDNKDWITDDKISDPEVLPKVHGWNLILRPVPIKNKVGSVIVPETIRDDIKNLTNVGRVLAVGPLAYSDKERTGTEPWVKVGDLVAFPRFSGNRFVYRGIRLVLIEDTAMLMTLESAEDIDPTKILSE